MTCHASVTLPQNSGAFCVFFQALGSDSLKRDSLNPLRLYQRFAEKNTAGNIAPKRTSDTLHEKLVISSDALRALQVVYNELAEHKMESEPALPDCVEKVNRLVTAVLLIV